MKKVGDSFELSATDLVGHLHCRHLNVLDRAVAEGALARPKVWDPLLQILAERGAAHERDYIEHLTSAGLDVTRIDGVDVTNDAAEETVAAMRRGAPIIVQGALSDQGWNGRADVLRRVEVPSAWGSWSYEVIDTKLARETKAESILQLCLYSDLLTAVQGLPPEYMYVVAPWSNFEPQQYRFADYAAYFRKVKRALLTAMAEPPADDTKGHHLQIDLPLLWTDRRCREWHVLSAAADEALRGRPSSRGCRLGPQVMELSHER
jgi:uncharacterized protein